jgi:prepilin peptidase CpaA
MTMHLVVSWLEPALLWTSVGLLVLASWHDIAARVLPNWSAAAIASSGLLLRVVDGSWMISLGAAFAVFALAAFCWRRGWLGGGDVKLLAACALLVPPGDVLDLVLATSLAGGVLGVVYLLLGIANQPRRSRPAAREPSGPNRAGGMLAHQAPGPAAIRMRDCFRRYIRAVRSTDGMEVRRT